MQRNLSDVGGASSQAALLEMMTGCWISQAIHAAARLGIADLLGDGPRSSAALAEVTHTHPGALHRLLRALASVGIFAMEADGRFRLTPLACELQSDAPGSLRGFALLLGTQEHWRAWEGLLHAVGTGRPAFEQVFGQPFFSYLANHPDAARTFDEAMTSRSRAENTAIASTYPFPDGATIIDVGGGQGMLLAAILASYPNARGVLFDLPHVIERSCSYGDPSTGVRCTSMAGDFFSAVPPGGDVYLLKKIIHDWDDEHARRIMVNCRRAMSATARLLLIEPVIPAGDEPSFNKRLDLLMLIWHGGRERTEREHGDLLASAGFQVSRVIPTGAGVSIIEALPA